MAKSKPALELAARTIPRDKKLVMTQSRQLGRSTQELTLTEKRIFATVIAVHRMTDVELQEVRIDVADYRRLFGANYNSVAADLERTVDTLTTRNVVFTQGRGSKASYSLFERAAFVASVDSEDGRPYLTAKLHPDMKDHILSLTDNFFSPPLEPYAKHRSTYAWRMAEILQTEARGRERFTVTLDIEELKQELGATRYENYAHFNREVLKRTKAEADKIKYVTFDYQPIKRDGVRRYTDLVFNVRIDSAWAPAPNQREQMGRMKIVQLLHNVGFNSIPEEYFEYLGANAIERIYKDTRAEEQQRANTSNPIKNFGGYLRQKLTAAYEEKRGMLRFAQDTAQEGSATSISTRATKHSLGADPHNNPKLFDLADKLLRLLDQERQEYAIKQFDALPEAESGDMLARIWADLHAPIPTLVALPQSLRGQKVDAKLPEHLRRRAIVALMEREQRVKYQGPLKDPKAFAKSQDLFAEYPEEHRKLIIQTAQQQYLDDAQRAQETQAALTA